MLMLNRCLVRNTLRFADLNTVRPAKSKRGTRRAGHRRVVYVELERRDFTQVPIGVLPTGQNIEIIRPIGAEEFEVLP